MFLPQINRQWREQHQIQPDLKLIEQKQQHANRNRSHKIIISSTTEGSGEIDPETLGSKERENNRKWRGESVTENSDRIGNRSAKWKSDSVCMKRLRKRKEEDQRFDIVTFGDETFVVYSEIAEREKERERHEECFAETRNGMSHVNENRSYKRLFPSFYLK